MEKQNNKVKKIKKKKSCFTLIEIQIMLNLNEFSKVVFVRISESSPFIHSFSSLFVFVIVSVRCGYEIHFAVNLHRLHQICFRFENQEKNQKIHPQLFFRFKIDIFFLNLLGKFISRKSTIDLHP